MILQARRYMMGRYNFREEMVLACELFQNAIYYPMDELIEMNHLSRRIEKEKDEAKKDELIERFHEMRVNMKPVTEKPWNRVYIWPEGRMPSNTGYNENTDFKYNHNPDFVPYMHEILIQDGRKPKGAVLLVTGGDQGRSLMAAGFQSAWDLNELGYQCFVLALRVNGNPWSKQDNGADIARAIRYIRANAGRYRIKPDQVAAAGFSNGGLSIDNNIRFFSGKQTVKDTYPDYEPDELDEFYGAPDAFLCIYGPRFEHDHHDPDYVYDYTDVVYPPTFIAVGRDDGAMKNLSYYYDDLLKHGVNVEVHTFAGTPHGCAGYKMMENGFERYKNFNLWLPLADYFMQDVYDKEKIHVGHMAE